MTTRPASPPDGAAPPQRTPRAAISPDDRLEEAVAHVRERIAFAPEMALILGSGLGQLAEEADGATVVPASDIPGYPASTVAGHDGQLVFGMIEGQRVVFVQGRVHYYEGYPIHRVVYPVRLVEALGATCLLVTNSAGGINRQFEPGTLMFITDHINYALASPAVGSGIATRDTPGTAARDTPMRRPYYDVEWTDQAEDMARSLGIPTRRGVYLWTKGPSYETKAEIRAFERLGADAVGMSTVPEVIQAQALGMRVLGLSTITNPAAGLGDEPLDHDDVLAVGQRVRSALRRLVRGIVREAR